MNSPPNVRQLRQFVIVVTDATAELRNHRCGTFADSLARILDHLLDRIATDEQAGPVPGLLRLASCDTDSRETDKILAEVEEAAHDLLGRAIGVDDLGVLYDLVGSTEDRDMPRSTRRSDGRYLTPPALAASLVDATLGGIKTRQSVLDPAAGAGVMLVHVLRQVRSASTQDRRQVARSLYGVDRDSVAVGLARALIWLECRDPNWDGAELLSNLRVGDSLLSSMEHWRSWFPEVFDTATAGFGAIITNPPWNSTRALRSEYLAEWQGSPAAFEQAWAAHLAEERNYSQSLAQHPEYMDQGSRNDKDLYKYFLERIFHLLGEDGVAGFLLPSGFLRTSGAADLRRRYLDHGEFTLLAEFINRERLFPIHAMFRFILGVYSRSSRRGIRRYLVEQTNPADLPTARGVSLQSEILDKVAGPLSWIPEVRSSDDLSLLAKFHRMHPPLGASTRALQVRFRRELDMTLDKRHFIHVAEAEKAGWRPEPDGSWRRDDTQQRLIPVFEGRMVQQFDSAAKTYVRGRGRSATWRPSSDPSVRPQFLIEGRFAEERIGEPLQARPGFCDVSGHANERTVLAAIIPPMAICGNKVPTVRSEPNNFELDLFWLGVVNSFTFDWMFRRWVSTTLNLFYWRNLPFPDLAPGSREVRQIAEAAAALSGVTLTGRPSRRVEDPWQRGGLRAAIEATVADIFDLTLDEYEHVLEDFPLVDRDQPASATCTSTVTKDVARLAVMRARSIDDRLLCDRLAEAKASKAVPFVPAGFGDLRDDCGGGGI